MPNTPDPKKLKLVIVRSFDGLVSSVFKTAGFDPSVEIEIELLDYAPGSNGENIARLERETSAMVLAHDFNI